jgi:hypothetical protein
MESTLGRLLKVDFNNYLLALVLIRNTGMVVPQNRVGLMSLNTEPLIHDLYEITMTEILRLCWSCKKTNNGLSRSIRAFQILEIDEYESWKYQIETRLFFDRELVN